MMKSLFDELQQCNAIVRPNQIPDRISNIIPTLAGFTLAESRKVEEVREIFRKTEEKEYNRWSFLLSQYGCGR